MITTILAGYNIIINQVMISELFTLFFVRAFMILLFKN